MRKNGVLNKGVRVDCWNWSNDVQGEMKYELLMKMH